jgi:hypothetical protein
MSRYIHFTKLKHLIFLNRGSNNYVPLGIKEVEENVIFKGAYKLKLFIDEIYETSGVANKQDLEITHILIYCMDTFENDVHVLNLMRRVPQIN